MNKLEQLIIKLKTYDFQKAIQKILKGKEQEIINLLTKEQIYKGIKGDGSAITPTYTPQYQKIKQAKGLYQGFVDLHLSGDYLESFKAVYQKEDVIIESNRMEEGFNLSEHLKKRYGSLVEEFTNEHYLMVIELIKSGLYDDIKKTITNL